MNQVISIKQIPANTPMQGYIWYSDRTEPEIIDMQNFSLENSEVPFVIEAQLCDVENQKSYAIRHVGGKTIVNQFDWSQMKEGWVKDKCKNYLPNRMDNIKALKFVQYWKTNIDPFCLDMKVLEPACLVFMGFIK